MGCMGEGELTWKTPPHTLTLHKTNTGSLGFAVKTTSRVTDNGPSSVTTVYSISPNCTVQDHSVLEVNDRIVSIDGKSIIKSSKEDVYAIIKAHNKPYISLGVCRAVKTPVDNNILKEDNLPISLSRREPPLYLQRLLSGVSSDSGRGSSPRTGDTNGCFVFENTNNNSQCERVTDILHVTPGSLSSRDKFADITSPACEGLFVIQATGQAHDNDIVLRNSPDQFSSQCTEDPRDIQTRRSLSGNSGVSQQSYAGRLLSQNGEEPRHIGVQRTSSQSSGDSLTVNVRRGKRPGSHSSSSRSDNGSENHGSSRCCSTCRSVLTSVTAVNEGRICVVNGEAAMPYSDKCTNCVHNQQTVSACMQADAVCPSLNFGNLYPSERVNSLPTERFYAPQVYDESPHHTRSLPLSPIDDFTTNCSCHQSVDLACSFTDMAFIGVDSNKVVSMAARSTSKASCADCLTISQQILKYPQNVRWDPNTKVVTLNRANKKASPGVSFTHPFSKNKDGSVDAYTLVERIEKGGAADGKLFVGDWIRSVNGKPLHKASEALSVASLLEMSETVRFVIQRPVDMKRAQGDLKISSDKPGKHGNYSPSAATECCENFSTCHPGNVNCDKSVVINNGQTLNKHKRIERYFSSSSRGSNNSGHHQSPNSPRSCTCVNYGSSSFHQSVSSTGNCIDIFSLAKTRFAMEDTVKFPSMKLFVLGRHALRMTELLLPNSTQQLAAHGKEKFFHLSCLVREDTEGVTKLYLNEGRSACENDLSGVLSQFSDGNQTGICEEDIEFDIATQSGSDHLPRCFSRMTSRTQNSVTSVNLDIFVFTEEKFFSQCAPVLFSKNVLFFVTFDGGRVLENTTEMSRIGQLVHEIRTNSGVDSPLFLYGFLDTDTSDAVSTCTKTDELKALFYTDHGRQILRYTNVAMPHFVTQSGNSLENACQSARQLIGRIVIQQEFLTGQLHIATLAAMAWIHQLRRQGCQLISMSDLREGIHSLIPDIRLESLLKMIRELNSAGTILLTDESLEFDHGTSLNQTVFIQPIHALQCLQSFLSELEKPVARNSPRETTGMNYPTSATKTILQKAFQVADCSKVKFEDFFQLLQKLKLVHNVLKSHEDYWLTYFLPETQTCDNDMTEDHVLYVQLDSFLSGAVFLLFVNKLAEVCEAVRISVLSFNAGDILLHDCMVWLEHMWKEDRIKLTFRFVKSNISTSQPCAFLENLMVALKSCLPSHLHYHLCVPCPLGEECDAIRGRQPHLIDILRNEPNVCGNHRVDNLKAINIWQDGIHRKGPGDRGSGGGPPFPKEKKKFDWSTPVLKLPFDLLSALFLQLLIPMPMDNDWTGFAGCIGMTVKEVALYKIQKNAAQELITDWSRINRSTVHDLIDVLSSQDMQRQDLVDMIKDKLSIS